MPYLILWKKKKKKHLISELAIYVTAVEVCKIVILKLFQGDISFSKFDN